MSEFQASEWFQRGWTLQELLAPKNVTFVDCWWRIIGNKVDLRCEIRRITDIPQRYVVWPDLLIDASVAIKMSWASKRRTSRVEDMAYCLMGIFNVNMPLLYGEGDRAFQRLQHEIIKTSDDESIFAWDVPQKHRTSTLAPHISNFSIAGNVETQGIMNDRPPYSITHKGLKLHVPAKILEGAEEIAVPLLCSNLGSNGDTVLAFTLKQEGKYQKWRRRGVLRSVPSSYLWSRQDCSHPNKATIYVPLD